MHLIAIGRLSACPEAMLFDRYNARLRPKLTVVELAEERGAASVIKRKEGTAMLAAMRKEAFVVPLDLGGRSLDSETFAAQLVQWSSLSRTISFLIGGAEGLDSLVIQQADYVLSLGSMTWPHFMVRAMLAEQLYRAQTIIHGHPYHRAGRP